MTLGMDRLLCWLGWHRWSYGVDETDQGTARSRHCSRCWLLLVDWDQRA